MSRTSQECYFLFKCLLLYKHSYLPLFHHVSSPWILPSCHIISSIFTSSIWVSTRIRFVLFNLILFFLCRLSRCCPRLYTTGAELKSYPVAFRWRFYNLGPSWVPLPESYKYVSFFLKQFFQWYSSRIKRDHFILCHSITFLGSLLCGFSHQWQISIGYFISPFSSFVRLASCLPRKVRMLKLCVLVTTGLFKSSRWAKEFFNVYWAAGSFDSHLWSSRPFRIGFMTAVMARSEAEIFGIL